VEALGAEIPVDSPLKGVHQHRNLALAMAAAVELKRSFGFPVTPAAMEAGIQQTRWPARLERIEADGVEWILDVAHNPAGAWALRAGLRTILKEGQPHAVVFSCLRDKPVRELAQILFPLFDQVILVPLQAARAAAMDDLLAAARMTGTPATAAASVREAVRMAAERARSGTISGATASATNGSVVISGSVYLVGEARGLLIKKKEEESREKESAEGMAGSDPEKSQQG
jgi:dihydrofolate synthase/folylpolyglutamate synthase